MYLHTCIKTHHAIRDLSKKIKIKIKHCLAVIAYLISNKTINLTSGHRNHKQTKHDHTIITYASSTFFSFPFH